MLSYDEAVSGQKTPVPDEGLGDFVADLARFAIGQGALMGGGDELEALTVAADTGRNYEDVLAETRQQLEAFRTKHPYWATGAEMVGAMAVPGGAMMKGATLGAKMARGGIAGGVYGAGYGFGTGEGGVENRGTGAVAGGLTGAGVGAVVPAAGAGISHLGKTVMEKAAPGMAMFNRGKPEEATIGRALSRDEQLGAGGLSEAEYIAAQQRGQPVTTMDRGGTMTHDLARTAGNMSDEGRTLLHKTVDDRYVAQQPRVIAYLSRMIGGKDALDIQDTLRDAARAANRPAYELAYKTGQNVWNETLENLTRDPYVQKAIRGAEKRGVTKAINEGFEPVKNPFTKTKDGGLGLKTNPDGSRALPNAQFWDYVKRGLDKEYNKVKVKDTDAARDIDALRKTLLKEVDSMAPDFAAARSGAAAFFGANDALEAGMKIATGRMSNSEVKRGLAKMNTAERRLAMSGFVSELVDIINRPGQSRDVVKKIWDSPTARERIRLVLGPRRSRDMEAFMRVEQVMQTAREAVKGNSKTAQYLMDAGILSAGTISGQGQIGSTDQIIAAALVGGRRHVNRKFATQLARMLASDDPQQYQSAMTAVARSPGMMEGLRIFDGKIARVAAQQAAQAIQP